MTICSECLRDYDEKVVKGNIEYCGYCHGTHLILYNLREQMEYSLDYEKKDIKEEELKSLDEHRRVYFKYLMKGELNGSTKALEGTA